MNFLKNFCGFVFICAISAAAASGAQSPLINGPFLGFIPDHSGRVISPIIGVPGASTLADPIELTMGVRGTVISPKQDYAMAVAAEDGQTVVINFTSNGVGMAAIAGAQTGPDIIALSPSGSAGVLYAPRSNTLQVIGYLPQTP